MRNKTTGEGDKEREFTCKGHFQVQQACRALICLCLQVSVRCVSLQPCLTSAGPIDEAQQMIGELKGRLSNTPCPQAAQFSL